MGDAPAREVATVALGWFVTFLFSFFFYGWPALQALLELDGVYKELCPGAEVTCPKRGSRMMFLFSVDNTVTTFAGASKQTACSFPLSKCVVNGLHDVFWSDLYSNRAVQEGQAPGP